MKSYDKELISIIAPVYNIAEYLPRCIDSILNQTHKNLEIILINDGSTDSSGEICDDYAKKDSRVIVIHQENAGVSAARNAGLEASCGEWIGFIDPDDWVAPGMYAELLQAAHTNNKFLACCGYVTYYSKERNYARVREEIPKIITREDSVLYCLDINHRYYGAHIFLFIFHSSIINSSKLPPIRFDASVHHGEDRLFLVQALMRADGITYVADAFYYYFQRSGSAKYTVNKKRMDVVYALNQIIALTGEMPPNIAKSAQIFFVRHLSLLLSYLCHNRQYEHVPMLRREIRRHAYVSYLTNAFSLRKKMENLAVLILPKYIVGLLSRIKRRKLGELYRYEEV